MEAAVAEAWHGWRHMVGLVTGVTRGRVETWTSDRSHSCITGCMDGSGQASQGIHSVVVRRSVVRIVKMNNGHSEGARWSETR